MTICSPVSNRENPMMMRRILRCVRIPHKPISTSRKPVVRRMCETGSSIPIPRPGGSVAKPVDDDAEFSADFDAKQRRNEGDGSGAEQCAEITGWQDMAVEEASREDQA